MILEYQEHTTLYVVDKISKTLQWTVDGQKLSSKEKKKLAKTLEEKYPEYEWLLPYKAVITYKSIGIPVYSDFCVWAQSASKAEEIFKAIGVEFLKVKQSS